MNRYLSKVENIRSQGSNAICAENFRLRNRCCEIEAKLGPDWEFAGSGRHRKVYKRGNIVLKIPMNLNAVEANIMEREIYRFRKKEGRFAPCRLLGDGCLIMRFVTDLDGKPHLPPWAWDLIDGTQVGSDRNGKIMAYDYSEEYY